MGSFEIYRKFDGSSLKVERQTVHVSDDTGRIAMLEKRTFGKATDDNNTDATLVRYIYSNHLPSASLELDKDANIISYEEYHPYGTTSYQAMNASIKATAKRYRYTGKERDEESGLYYHGARYYIPWLARWTAIDPMEAKYAGMSPYNYSFNNPVMWNDPSGADPEDPPSSYRINPQPFTDDGYRTEQVLTTFDDGTEGYVYQYAGDTPEFLEFMEQSTDLIKATDEYNSFNFNQYGYYRNNYSSEGFSDPYNYLRFVDNAVGSIWNFGVDIFHSVRNFSIEGLGNELSATWKYNSETSISQQWSDTKSQLGTMFSDIRTYENLGGAFLTMNATNISRGITTATTPNRITFYTVQGVDDATRLRQTGNPWPSSPTRAHLGEGVYAWGSKIEAQNYTKALGLSEGSIMEFSIRQKTFNKFSKFEVPYNDILANKWLGTHSSLYGIGKPHGFNYVIRQTGMGPEHFFDKQIFNTLKFKK